MRPAIERLREQFDRQYPLATARPWIEASDRELVLRIQEEVSLEPRLHLIVVRNGQLVLTQPAAQFVRSAVFDQGIVTSLHPHPELDTVFLDPLRQFGEPVVRSVPTTVIAEQIRSGDSIAMIAALYELSEATVEQAIRYELMRGREGRQAA